MYDATIVIIQGQMTMLIISLFNFICHGVSLVKIQTSNYQTMQENF